MEKKLIIGMVVDKNEVGRRDARIKEGCSKVGSQKPVLLPSLHPPPPVRKGSRQGGHLRLKIG